MREVWGNSVSWLRAIEHWDIRKAFTLPNYRSSDIDTIFTKILQSKPNIFGKELRHFLDKEYERSAHTLMSYRFDTYLSLLPPSSYRRTSIDFKMERNINSRIGAFVDAKSPTIVWMNDGTLSAVEDASQVLLALWKAPIGLQFLSTATFQLPYSLGQIDPSEMFATFTNMDDIFPLRLEYKKFENTFVEYSANFSKQIFLQNHKYNVNGKPFDIPINVLSNFLLVSKNPSRQIFADNLSQASLLWIIAHEDAHKYSGHIRHFDQLGLNVQDQLFNELVAPFDDSASIEKRRAAEFEADTCATMRTIDMCFDSEFLEILTDWMSFEMREEIYRGKKRFSELEARQRLVLMRFLSTSILLPLTVFDIAVSSTPSSNLECYPPFIIRALNVIFTIASRAVDVSLSKPHYRVGSFDIREFEIFFARALQDMMSIYTTVQSVMDTKFRFRTRPFPSDLQPILISLNKAFFLCHDQPWDYYRSNPLNTMSDPLDLSFFREDEIITDFLVERQKMYLHRINTFLEAKKQVNVSRLDKVLEDIEFAERAIEIARKFYSFVP